MPAVAEGTAVRYVDVAAPWLADVGGASMGQRYEAAAVARVSLRYDETKADLVHDDEYEAVLFPLEEQLDISRVVQVDYDDRDLRQNAPDGAVYRLTARRSRTRRSGHRSSASSRTTWSATLAIELPANTALKLYGRPGETPEDSRCVA